MNKKVLFNTGLFLTGVVVGVGSAETYRFAKKFFGKKAETAAAPAEAETKE